GAQAREPVAERWRILERDVDLRRHRERLRDHALLRSARGMHVEDEVGRAVDLVMQLDRIADTHLAADDFVTLESHVVVLHRSQPHVGGRSQYGLKPQGVDVSLPGPTTAGSTSITATGRSASASTTTLQPRMSSRPFVAKRCAISGSGWTTYQTRRSRSVSCDTTICVSVPMGAHACCARCRSMRAVRCAPWPSSSPVAGNPGNDA